MPYPTKATGAIIASYDKTTLPATKLAADIPEVRTADLY